MSGRMGVKKDDVFLACEELVKKGAYVTIANVRQELGTGSYGTLVPLVAEWKKNREEAAAEEKEIPSVPIELLNLGQKFIADIWAESATIHQKQVTELEIKHSEAIERLSDEVRSKAAEIEQSLEDIKEFEQRQEALESEAKANDSKLHQKDGEISLLKEQLKAKDKEIAALLERAIRAEQDADIKKQR